MTAPIGAGLSRGSRGRTGSVEGHRRGEHQLSRSPQRDPVGSSAAPVKLPSIAFGGPVLLTRKPMSRHCHSCFSVANSPLIQPSQYPAEEGWAPCSGKASSLDWLPEFPVLWLREIDRNSLRHNGVLGLAVGRTCAGESFSLYFPAEQGNGRGRPVRERLRAPPNQLAETSIIFDPGGHDQRV